MMMVTAAQLRLMRFREVPVAALRARLAVGLKQQTKAEIDSIRTELSEASRGKADVFQVVLDAVRKEVLMSDSPFRDSVLCSAVTDGNCEIVMAVAEKMRKEGVRESSSAAFGSLYRSCSIRNAEVEAAVVSVIDPSAFGDMTADYKDALHIAVCCYNKDSKARALEAVLKYGPSMEERLEAGMQRFRYVHVAAEHSDLETLQQMHDMLPLLADGSGRRGEVADYAGAIELLTVNLMTSDAHKQLMAEYLVEQAGGDEVFDHCNPTILLTAKTRGIVHWLVGRAPRLVEAMCKDKTCLSLLITKSMQPAYLIKQMVELVDPEVLCGVMRQPTPPAKLRKKQYGDHGWRSMLKPVHDAVPACMDGQRWKWLIQAIKDKAYGDVVYMVGMCTREHLSMRNSKGETAYDLAAADRGFPQDVLDRLKVVHMVKGANM